MLIDEPYRTNCIKIFKYNYSLFKETPGALKNHQSYPGGYIHHIEEVMNIARVLHDSYSLLRPLPFKLSDALMVLFLHDIEKPWKYELADNGELKIKDNLLDKENQKVFRSNKIDEYGIDLSEDHKNALEFMGGEKKAYSYYKRVRGPLAAFCGQCDSASARIWFDYPKEAGDEWKAQIS
mgnify:CR=1 FL=1